MFMMGMHKSSSISRDCNAVEAWKYVVVVLSDSVVSSEAPTGQDLICLQPYD